MAPPPRTPLKNLGAPAFMVSAGWRRDAGKNTRRTAGVARVSRSAWATAASSMRRASTRCTVAERQMHDRPSSLSLDCFWCVRHPGISFVSPLDW